MVELPVVGDGDETDIEVVQFWISSLLVANGIGLGITPCTLSLDHLSSVYEEEFGN